MPSSPHNSVVLETKAHLGPNLGLGSVSKNEIVDSQSHVPILGFDFFICSFVDL